MFAVYSRLKTPMGAELESIRNLGSLVQETCLEEQTDYKQQDIRVAYYKTSTRQVSRLGWTIACRRRFPEVNV